MAAQRIDFDGVVIVGAGLAGLCAALSARPRRVLLLASAPLGQGCASAWAQGGMAAALGDDDDAAQHASDTMAAGAGLCDGDAVAVLTGEGPDAVRRLAALGAPFDRRLDGGFAQSLEAAHGRARVARVGGDGAGAAIMAAVIAAVRADPRIEVREGWRVVGLLTDGAGRVRGARAVQDGATVEIRAPATVLATGGVGGLYAVTTNPMSARGEGLALAALAGAEIRDAEFVQFHPTAIDVGTLGADPTPLATEALRGEGARLTDAAGTPFMTRWHPAGDLAPRDVVARAIAGERRAGRPAFLDARAAVGAHFPTAFPAVFAACVARGLDPRRALIPVQPAAHYHMGGVAADIDGRTSLPGLFAVGECAAAGVHGANRLASNSLLEAAVFGRRAGLAARDALGPRSWGAAFAGPRPSDDPPAEVLRDLRGRMSRDAGVVRDGAGLAGLLAWIGETEAVHGPAAPLVAARLIVEGALARQESRGAHFRADFPEMAQEAVHGGVVLGAAQVRRAA